MNYLDIILCAIIAFFAIRSTLQGAMREIFSLLALIAGIIVSSRFYAPAAALLIPYIDNQWARIIIACSAIFILVYICINTAGWLIAKLIKFIHLSPLDRFAGFFIGTAKGYLIACLLIIMLLMLAPPGSKLLKESRVSVYSIPFIEKMVIIFPASFKTIITEKTRELKKPAQSKFSV
jgi:membrane protein required for colicin V production